MDLSLATGRYVIAVSGGVDSMVLLDILANRPELDLIVAHYDHGIRNDSDLDRQLVERAAARYGLPFVHEHGHLGASASEATARDARYEFLRRIKTVQDAEGIITAHHQDDLIETAIINMLRGTGRKGLSSLRSTNEIIRPMLNVSKQDIYTYAARHAAIVWREDSTNQNDYYLRNYIRLHITKGLNQTERRQLVDHISRAAETNSRIDALLLHEINTKQKDGLLDRRWFTLLPFDMSCEVMAAWLRSSGIREFDRQMIDRLVIGGKNASAGKKLDINTGYLLEVTKYGLRITTRNLSR